MICVARRIRVFVPVQAVRLMIFLSFCQATAPHCSLLQAQMEPTLGLAVLPTVSVREGKAKGFNQQIIDESRQLSLRQGLSILDSGCWLLDFTFKPLRWQTIHAFGSGGRDVLYLSYRIVNRTGKPRVLAPRFILVTDGDQPKEESVIPRAVRIIQERDDPSTPLLGAVSIMGTIPPSTAEGTDLAVFGVALWEGVSRKARTFHIYVQGLSDACQLISGRGGAQPTARYKTLRIDFVRRGQALVPSDPPYEWIYR
jgi:hypothetical protein